LAVELVITGSDISAPPIKEILSRKSAGRNATKGGEGMGQRELDLILIRFDQLEQKLDRLLEICENAENGSDNGTSINQDSPHDTQHTAG
jgi:hypothetical protein